VRGTTVTTVPDRRSRALVAAEVATVAVFLTWAEHVRVPGRPTDFGEIWFGARALLHGLNPYLLIGPGRAYEWDWVSPYPITTFVAAIPFTVLSEFAAAIVFVWLSSWAFAFSITRKGWQRLFLIPSAAFIVAARSAQWSPLFAAIFLQPALGWFLSVKPNIGAAVGLASASKRTIGFAIGGGVILVLLGFFLMPHWVSFWIENVRSTRHLVVPLMLPGGFLVLLAALRWRSPDARLLVALALFPQTGSWYESLPVLLVAETRRECQLLTMISSIGFIVSAHLVEVHTALQVNRNVATYMVWFVYIPATFIVLRKFVHDRRAVSGREDARA
jgi:hypothetical protein